MVTEISHSEVRKGLETSVENTGSMHSGLVWIKKFLGELDYYAPCSLGIESTYNHMRDVLVFIGSIDQSLPLGLTPAMPVPDITISHNFRHPNP